MSDSVKIRAVWASVTIAALMLLLGSGSFLLNVRTLAAIPERVDRVERRVESVEDKLAAHEKWGNEALLGLREDLAEIKAVLGIKRKGTP